MKDWTPTPENINKLPPRLRDYIHALETNCDPAGLIQKVFALETQVAALLKEERHAGERG